MNTNLTADEQDWHNADQFAAWLRKRADENRRVAALPPDQWPRSPSLLQHLAHRFEQGAAIVEQLEAARKRDFEQALANGTRALRYREALQEIASYPPGTLRPLADEIAIHRLAIEALGSRSAVETSAPPLTLCLQAVMAELADLLDSDKFNRIEAMVLRAGVPYPPLGTDPRTQLPAETAAEPSPCEHLRSELLAEKTKDGEPLFQMRKCLDCGKGFRVRSSLKAGAPRE